MALRRLDSLSGVALSLAVLLAMATVEARQLGLHRGAAAWAVRMQCEAARRANGAMPWERSAD